MAFLAKTSKMAIFEVFGGFDGFGETPKKGLFWPVWPETPVLGHFWGVFGPSPKTVSFGPFCQKPSKTRVLGPFLGVRQNPQKPGFLTFLAFLPKPQKLAFLAKKAGFWSFFGI